MADDNSENITSEQVKGVPNPTGKGGFQDHPELINRGGRTKNEQRFGYWLQFFKNMTVREFLDYEKSKNNDEMFVAEAIAYDRVKKSRKELSEYKDLADRTEGKAVETNKIIGDPDHPLSIEIIEDTELKDVQQD